MYLRCLPSCVAQGLCVHKLCVHPRHHHVRSWLLVLPVNDRQDELQTHTRMTWFQALSLSVVWPSVICHLLGHYNLSCSGANQARGDIPMPTGGLLYLIDDCTVKDKCSVNPPGFHDIRPSTRPPYIGL